MNEKLKNIAQIHSGTYINSENYDKKGDAYFISLRNFNQKLQFDFKAPKVRSKNVDDRYIISKNDILLSVKAKFNAFQVPLIDGFSYIASNSLVILKPNIHRVTPDYLYWFLNHPITQKKLNYISQAQSRLPYISIKKLSDFPVEVPALSTQQQIIKIHSLHQREKEITLKIKTLKEQYIQTILLKSAEL